MFEDQTPNPNQVTPTKAEDIFAGVDNAASAPVPPISQPQFNPAQAYADASQPLEAEEAKTNRALFIAGGAVFGLLIIAIGVWAVLAGMANKPKGSATAPAPAASQAAQQEQAASKTADQRTDAPAPTVADYPVNSPAETITASQGSALPAANEVSNPLPAAATGSAAVANPSQNAPVAAGDQDNDGLTDEEEAKLGTNPLKSDTDGDDLSDFEEARTYGSSPVKADSDGDSYGDGSEVAKGYNPNGVGKLIISNTPPSYKGE